MQETNKTDRQVIERFLRESQEYFAALCCGYRPSLPEGPLGVIRTKYAHVPPPEAREYFVMARTVATTDPYQARQYLDLVRLYCTWPPCDFPEGYAKFRAQVEADLANRTLVIPIKPSATS